MALNNETEEYYNMKSQANNTEKYPVTGTLSPDCLEHNLGRELAKILTNNVYRMTLPDLPESSVFKHFIYTTLSQYILFPSEAYGLTNNEAFGIAMMYHGKLFEDEHGIIFIDTDSILRCMSAANAPDASGFAKAVTELKQLCLEIVALHNAKKVD